MLLRVASRLRALAWRAGLIAAFVGYAPTQAKGPLDGERIIAGVRMFYGPKDNLQQVDTDMIARARVSIDMAAYVLTNGAVTDALMAAARRGVRVRLYLDPDQPPQAGRAAERLMALARTPGISVRVKRGDHIMHLKAYQVDRRVLRTGSANFSIAGLQRQENDIVVIEAQDAVARFLRDFEDFWSRRDNLVWRGDTPLGAQKSRQGAAND
ncbi:MAG: phospholipase D-like domain-containing protein [Beijerinckiaceae bacterium]|nr:phospholipase D-like domain-containing protein [Beijerinckiaceae bacterium]